MENLSLIATALYFAMTVFYNFKTRKLSKEIYGKKTIVTYLIGYGSVILWTILFHYLLQWYMFNFISMILSIIFIVFALKYTHKLFNF